MSIWITMTCHSGLFNQWCCPPLLGSSSLSTHFKSCPLFPHISICIDLGIPSKSSSQAHCGLSEVWLSSSNRISGSWQVFNTCIDPSFVLIYWLCVCVFWWQNTNSLFLSRINIRRTIMLFGIFLVSFGCFLDVRLCTAGKKLCIC